MIGWIVGWRRDPNPTDALSKVFEAAVEHCLAAIAECSSLNMVSSSTQLHYWLGTVDGSWLKEFARADATLAKPPNQLNRDACYRGRKPD